MNFRIFSFIFLCGSVVSINGMENRVINASLIIDKTPKSAAYASDELVAALNAVGIHAEPFEIVVPVKTGPAIPGMPSYLPIKDLELGRTGTQLPFIIGTQEVTLTCTNNPVAHVSFEGQLTKYIEKFNQEPAFAHYQSYRTEYPKLRKRLIQEGLVKSAAIYTVRRQLFNPTLPEHGPRFKPYQSKKVNYKKLSSRQYSGRK